MNTRRSPHFAGMTRQDIHQIARNPHETAQRRAEARAVLHEMSKAAVVNARRAFDRATPTFEALYGEKRAESPRPQMEGAPRAGDDDVLARFEQSTQTPTAPVSVPGEESHAASETPAAGNQSAEDWSQRRLAVSRSTVFRMLVREYRLIYEAIKPDPTRHGEIAGTVRRLEAGRDAYEEVSRDIGAPWVMIGIIHGLEASFNFSRHLHNGDPLTARTVRIPRGRPKAGSPPFTWRESAVDALQGHGLHLVDAWPLERQLFELERYNGFGYRLRAHPSPYLWAASDHYVKGKFVRDGVFDPDAVSRQIGGAVLLKHLGVV